MVILRNPEKKCRGDLKIPSTANLFGPIYKKCQPRLLNRSNSTTSVCRCRGKFCQRDPMLPHPAPALVSHSGRQGLTTQQDWANTILSNRTSVETNPFWREVNWSWLHHKCCVIAAGWFYHKGCASVTGCFTKAVLPLLAAPKPQGWCYGLAASQGLC